MNLEQRKRRKRNLMKNVKMSYTSGMNNFNKKTVKSNLKLMQKKNSSNNVLNYNLRYSPSMHSTSKWKRENKLWRKWPLG